VSRGEDASVLGVLGVLGVLDSANSRKDSVAHVGLHKMGGGGYVHQQRDFQVLMKG
jgi:hypothetical protein